MIVEEDDMRGSHHLGVNLRMKTREFRGLFRCEHVDPIFISKSDRRWTRVSSKWRIDDDVITILDREKKDIDAQVSHAHSILSTPSKNTNNQQYLPLKLERTIS